MRTNRPFKDYQSHLKAHKDSSISKSMGFTKNKQDCQFQCMLIKDGKVCSYGFNDKKSFDMHSYQHKKTVKCTFQECDQEFSAFKYIRPDKALCYHLKSKHGIEFATCQSESCGAWFIDRISKNGTKFSANDQKRIHQDYNCFDFASPTNYYWYTISPFNDFVKDIDEADRALAIYHGESGSNLFRAFAQIDKFTKNQDDSEVSKDRKLDFIHDTQILNGNGIYLTMLSDDVSTSFKSSIENNDRVRTSEYSSTYFCLKN